MAIRLLTNERGNAKIRVVGVGGGGGNALNTMVQKGIEGVEFIAVNTDLQALENSKADLKIQIGKNLTNGLGAGMNFETGKKAVEENRDEIERALSGSDMVFVTAGMGGGTGTGGAPELARIAKSMNALVVAIVTTPFKFEGKPRLQQAVSGIENLKDEVDSLIVIPNQKIFDLITGDTTKREAFEMADRVLYNATRGISQIITKTGEINVDFADVRTIMKDMGDAMIGTGLASGDERALKSAKDALSNPLLEEIDITGSACVLTNICSNGNIKMSEIEKINDLIQGEAGEDAKYIFGVVDDEDMGDEIMVTVIATGFRGATQSKDDDSDMVVQENIIFPDTGKITKIPTPEELAQYDEPAIKRRKININDDLSEEDIKDTISDDDDDLGFSEFDFNEDFKKPAFLRRQMD
ncbi:MAG: cell division protein FtsZ [Ignavibacteriae bacterium]|nr:cell division protein FtsZ [Ignavibacteriota bacterium]MCB9242561.1 cell division protein FtsZ [Ignavibacteriales bacterium]